MTPAVSEMPPELIESWRALGLRDDRSLGGAMAHAAREHPAAPFHLHTASGSRDTTLGEIHAAGRRLAGSFHALGRSNTEADTMP